jgi:drug/metabolite transporter (DMT)-like permease
MQLQDQVSVPGSDRSGLADIWGAIKLNKWIILSLLSVYIIWSTTYLAIAIALESYPPYLMMGIRFVLAGGGLFIFLRWRGAPNPTRNQWRSATIVGALLLAGGMGSVATAEQWISSGLAATLIATAPVWVIVFNRFWGVTPSRTEWIGVALGVVGVALLSLEGNLQANPKGVLLIMFATACWSFGSIWMKHLEMPPGAMGSAAEMLAGGIILLVMAAVGGQGLKGTPTVDATLALIYLTTFGSLVTILAYMYLLKTVSPTLATSYSFVNPVLALALGVVLADEVVTGGAIIALPIILLGLAFIARRPRRNTMH